MTGTYDVASFNDAFRAEAELVSNKTSIARAAGITPNRKRILEIKSAYNKALKEIRADHNLSEQGKQQMIARAYTNVSREIERLTTEDRQAQIQRYDQIEREVFGNPASSGADAVSFRDACDRAAKLENAETAMIALGTAQMSGDAVLAKAITMRAWQAGWTDVTETYAVDNPETTDRLAELNAIRHVLDSTVSAVGGSMGRAMEEPAELRGVIGVAELAERPLPLTANDIFLGRGNGTITPQEEREFHEQNTAEALAENGAT